MKKKTTPRKQRKPGKLTAGDKARIDKDFDGMAALFSNDDAARNTAKKKRESEYTPPPAKTELDCLLDRLYELPIEQHDLELAGRVLQFFDEVGSRKPTIDLVYRALLFGAMLGKNPLIAPTMESLIADYFNPRFDRLEKEVGSDSMAKKVRRGIFMAKNGTKPFPGRDPICKDEIMKGYCARMWHWLKREHEPMTSQKKAALEIINKYQYRGTWQTLATHYRGYPPQELKEAWEDMQKRGGNAE